LAKIKPTDDYLKTLKRRYAATGKRGRGTILDEFVATTGYHRKHAIAMLNGQRVRIGYRAKRPRALVYGKDVAHALMQLVEWFDGISSKRLRVALDVELARLQAAGHLLVSAECYEKLKQISAATIDRIRHTQQQRYRKLRGGTKPGSLLKHQIPIRTFADWDDKKIGFLEMDLVQHDGGNPSGQFACTLNMTDVCTGWTEMMAVQNKAQSRVFAALQAIRARTPLDWLGIDSDNGAEFINGELIRYSEQEKLTFTRGRVARKNDNAFVEQKNWSVVRKLVGYGRFDTPKQVKLLNVLYERYRLYINYFLPVSKLVSKERRGSKVKRLFDVPKTPYQRLLDSSDVSSIRKTALRTTYAGLDVVKLHREIDRLSRQLLESRQS
jgi:hypothetical protein